MRKLTKILLAAGGLGLATAAVATPALSDVRFDLNFGTPGYYYYAPYGYYHYRPYYYRHYYHRPYYYRYW